VDKNANQHAGNVLSRRRLLGLGGAGLTVVALSQATAAPAMGKKSSRFDLTADARTLYLHAQLASVTVQQSFTFDIENDRLFVAQLLAGTPGSAANLIISEMSKDGALLGSMILRGYGHGVSIAAQPVDGKTYLWTEADANTGGWGTRLARFEWQDGADYERDAGEVTKFQPVPEALETTCAIDPVHETMVVRYHTSAGKRLAWFTLREINQALANGCVPERLADFPQPPGLGTFQGYAVVDDYLYVYDGNAYKDTNPAPGNTHLGVIDMRSGELLERVLTTTGSDLVFREPEGMAVSVSPSGKPLLFFGFASGVGGDRRSNLFYLTRTI
jgi:hypothetical protein